MSDSQELAKLKRENKRLRALLAEAVSLLNRSKHLIASGGATRSVRKASTRKKAKSTRARKARG